MLPDDVFRDRLEKALVELEAWAEDIRACAHVDIAVSQHYWGIAVTTQFPGACSFELMLKADQKFTLKLADEVYEERPIERFDLFLSLVRGIAAGRVDRIETLNADTHALLAISMRVQLAEGWDWIGERRPAPQTRGIEAPEERRVHRFLAYRR